MKFDSRDHEIAFWLAVVALTVMGLVVSIAEAGKNDQFTYCELAFLRMCTDPATCDDGMTPEEVQQHLKGKTPDATAPIPDGKGLNGFVQFYVADSGFMVALQFRNGHLFSGSNDYVAFLNGTECRNI